MEFPLASALASQLISLDQVASTNDDLVARAADPGLPEFTVVATTRQSAGRGRLGRTWEAPPGTSLAASVLLCPGDAEIPRDNYGWISLVAGLAMTRAIARIIPGRTVSLKWPNDVQIDGRKVCGILSELVGNGERVVVGAGVNLTIPENELPVPTATSLMLNGAKLDADSLADLVLSGYLGELRYWWVALGNADSRGPATSVVDAVTDTCSTIGREVRVSMPNGTRVLGRAFALDETGRLLVRRQTDGVTVAVGAGDITHLRYE